MAAAPKEPTTTGERKPPPEPMATSLADQYLDAPGADVTVQFRRYTNFGNASYQQGECAGFSRSQAAALERAGTAIIVDRMMIPPRSTDYQPGLQYRRK
jgi:hypothetical protein